MNLLLIFVVLMAISVCLVLSLAMLFGLFEYGLRIDFMVGLLFLSAICVYLAIFLKRILSPKGALLEFPGSDRLEKPVQAKITGLFNLGTFVLLGLVGIVFLQLESLRNWLGAGCVFLSLALLLLGKSELNARPMHHVDSSEPTSVSTIELLKKSHSTHRIAMLYTVPAFGIIGVYATWTFIFRDGSRLYSVWDLAGLLFLLVSYCAWSFMHGKALQRHIGAEK